METHSHPIRVLVRPPPAPSLPLPPQPPPPPAPDPSPPPKNGVVVVGFIGKRHHDVAHFINKIIDSHVFGSGNLDTSFSFEPDKINPEMSKWFESRKLSFYHDEDQGILYLQFSSVRCPVTEEESPETRRFESVFEEQEFGDLQGLLLMFSVCHIIILIQEGSRFDTQMLKKFRVLQAAKHTMAPFVRSQGMPTVTSRPRSSVHLRMPASGPKNPSPGKSRGTLNRNASTATVMSGLGSYTSLLPGQCTPVVLFVFLDDFTEIIHTSGDMEEPSETSSLNLSSSFNTSTRPGLPTKGSGSVVMLARPVSKSEGGLRKKLQSSLEAQIRFSIKKCRTLSGFESSHAGSRSGAIASSAPLFSLDASKAVSLVDACSTQGGESLEFAIGLVEEVLDGKATPDSLLLESHQQNANKEDILSVKEFIYRQADLLRGRGALVVNNNSGSAAGVGMFAAAAAAAAASASASASSSASAGSGKMMTAPELPTFEVWSSSSQLILHRILSAKYDCTHITETNRMHEEDVVSRPDIATSSNPFESAISHLENCVGVSTRFSNLWCQKVFPVAMEVYLDGLPPCYPSPQHEDHLKKAMRVLTSMLKGPAVQLYVKKLKDECTSIWCSGRQLCDAISLTGKPCMHQKHDIKTVSVDEIESHSSGFVYLHACACGRSRQLRPDPFDYETANNTSADCDKLLPAVQLPEGCIKAPIQSWNLIRIGGARYYDPSKGLLQSGFCATQKFLLRWTILLEKLKEASHSLLDNSEEVSFNRNISVDTVVEANNHTSRLGTDQTQNGVGIQITDASDMTGIGNKNVSVSRGLSNVTMRKPFSEVVAGPAAANSGFPPLNSRKLLLPDAETSAKLHHARNRVQDEIGEIVNNQESQKDQSIISIGEAMNNNGIARDACKYNEGFSRNDGNVGPLNTKGTEHIKAANSMKHATIYVGFEHECPRGHRFILNLDHLNELGSAYSVPEENVISVENSKKKPDPAKFGKLGGHGKTRRQSNGVIMGVGCGKTKNLEKSKERVANGNMGSNRSMQSIRQGKDTNERRKATDFGKDLDFDLNLSTVDDGDRAYSLLNRSLPIYMNCPHCRDSTTKNDTPNTKFASTISQLQRIFVVTPTFPIVLAADPVIQFELSCLPPSIPDREQKLQFRLGCPVILPPDSFLSLRLPFIYGVELEDGSLHSLKPFENQPQLTAYIMKGTTLQVVSTQNNLDPALVT